MAYIYTFFFQKVEICTKCVWYVVMWYFSFLAYVLGILFSLTCRTAYIHSQFMHNNYRLAPFGWTYAS